jgi:ABC-type glycerol-3-phosphate transport system substrate-binding protein
VAATWPTPNASLTTRRGWLRRWALAAAGGALAGAGCRASPPARPAPAAPVLTLVAQLDIPASLPLGTVQERTRLYEQILAQFEATRPGLRVRVVPYASTPANAAAIAAGTAPDVFADVAPSYPAYVQQQLLLRLDDFFRRDNIDLAIWSPTMVQALRTSSGTYAVSRGLDTYVFAVNLSLLDNLGLAYPSPDWTHQELGQLARSLASAAGAPGGRRRYGVSFQGGPGGFLGTAGEVVAGFGGAVTDQTRTRQTLSSAPSVQGLQWLVDELLAPQVGVNGTGNADLAAGTAGVQEIQQVQLLAAFLQWNRSGLRWTLQPPPVYPHGRAGGAAANYWAISATTAHPEQAWELLRWMSTEPPYQQFLMKTFLFPPALVALQDQWQATAEAVAPGLKGKGLQWFTASARDGWGQAEPYFAYANAQAIALDVQWWNRILSGAVSLQAGLAEADRQVTALEEAAAAEAPRQRALAGAFPTQGPAVASVPPGV